MSNPNTKILGPGQIAAHVHEQRGGDIAHADIALTGEDIDRAYEVHRAWVERQMDEEGAKNTIKSEEITR